MLNLENPIRHPDLTSRTVMNKRAWWLVLLGFLIPGTPQLLAGNRKLGRFAVATTLVLWTLLILLLALYFVAPEITVGVLTHGLVLLLVQWMLVAYATLWLILAFNTFRLVRFVRLSPRTQGLVAGLIVATLTLSSGAFAYAATLIGSTRSLIGDVFVAAPPVEPIDGRYNFLLLGGDAGADREGLRPDSMTVVSVDAETGEAVLIGLPRDLHNIPFPQDSVMAAFYPDGYSEQTAPFCTQWACLNTVFVDAEINYADAFANDDPSLPAGIAASMEAASGVTGLTIQFYVIIDMQGFSNLIDALGGIDVVVDSDVPIHTDETFTVVREWIKAGPQHLNGYYALWYARSRYDTSDYDRMQRQAKLQEAIIRQFSPSTLLLKFQEIAAAGAQVVDTNIPDGMISPFIKLAQKTAELPITKVELIPENGVDPQYPDYAVIRDLIALAFSPPPPTSLGPSV